MAKKTTKKTQKSSAKAVQQQSNKIEKLGMFNITVKEIEKVKEFYTSTLGFTVVVENKYGNNHFIKMDVPGGSSINLIKENPEYPDGLKPGVMKLYLFSSDIEQTYNDLKAKNVKLNTEIQEQQWDKKVKQFDLNDPDGNNWVVVQFFDQGLILQ